MPGFDSPASCMDTPTQVPTQVTDDMMESYGRMVEHSFAATKLVADFMDVYGATPAVIDARNKTVRALCEVLHIGLDRRLLADEDS